MQFQNPAPADYPIHEALRQRWSPRAFSRDLVTAQELHLLFEALRWSPSAFNEQPWVFLVSLRQQPEEFEQLLSCLTPGNHVWAKHAAGLFVTVARRDLASKPQRNRTAEYDLGQAVAHFTFQATALGLVVHQMAGIDLEKARAVSVIPEGYDPVTAVAFGRPGDSSQLPEDVRKKDAAPRARKRLPDFVFGPLWGQTPSWLDRGGAAGPTTVDPFAGTVSTVNRAAEAGRTDFYRRASAKNLAPLWRVLHGLVTETPQSGCVPAQWKYRDVRPYVMEACSQISTEEAERRVMVLENPGLPGQSRITQSLFGGLQIILPGETAPAHRHTASALRFIIEGRDAYTAVAGERTMMEPGDFVITPSMTWHDHGNVGDAPMIWLDGLDMHIVNLMAASFRDGYAGRVHPVDRPEGAAMAEAGYNLLPVDHRHAGQTSPIFNYPYSRTREALDRLSRFRAVNEWHGHKMRYVNPVNGGWAMPTIATWMQLLPKDFTTRPYRSTDSTAFVVVEGCGHTIVGDQRFDWEPHDIFVVPSWTRVVHHANEEATLFSYSDRAVQEKLDLLREEAL